MLEWASLRSRHEGGNGGDLPAEPRIIEPQPEKKAGIALALGGGAARGWAHIGVLRALDEAGIEIDMIAGTSIGALVGGCYLAGKLDELEEFARSLTKRRIFGLLDLHLGGSGLLGGLKLTAKMQEHLNGTTFDDLAKPFVCVAAEIRTGHEIWLSSGSLITAMRASYALPGVFEPVSCNRRVLVDGALVNPVPVSVCRALRPVRARRRHQACGRRRRKQGRGRTRHQQGDERARGQARHHRGHGGSLQHHPGPHFARAHGRRSARPVAPAQARPYRPDRVPPRRRGDPPRLRDGEGAARRNGAAARRPRLTLRQPDAIDNGPPVQKPAISRRNHDLALIDP
jgi:predicted acylesterase/phospholipase RssA